LSSALRDFIFRGLLFESESNVFRKAGINIGADITQSEAHLLADSLDLFSIERRNDALEMARLYAVLHAFENTVRSMIRGALEKAKGPRWWDTDAVPEKMRNNVKKREHNIRKNS
jgi:glucuronate isomerase